MGSYISKCLNKCLNKYRNGCKQKESISELCINIPDTPPSEFMPPPLGREQSFFRDDFYIDPDELQEILEYLRTTADDE